MESRGLHIIMQEKGVQFDNRNSYKYNVMKYVCKIL